MKKQIFTLAFALCAIYGYSQNTNPWPATGKVGIGTSSPLTNLDVVYTSSFGGTISVAYFGHKSITNTYSGLYIQSINYGLTNKIQSVENSMNSGFIEFSNPMTTNTSKAAVSFGHNGIEAMRINQNGRVRIGSGTSDIKTPNGYKLFVEEGILTEKMKVAVKTTANWADYVFASDYKLMPLEEVELFTKQNSHLPNVPSAKDMVIDGLDVATMDAKLLEKIEELTLYAIDQNNKAKELSAELAEQKKEVEVLKAQMKLLLQKQ